MAADTFKPKPIVCDACSSKAKPLVRGHVTVPPRSWVTVIGPFAFHAVYCSEACARTAFASKAWG